MWRIFGLIFFGDKLHFVDAENKRYREAELKSFLQEKGVAIYDTAQKVIRTKNTASDKDLQVVEPSDLDGMPQSIAPMQGCAYCRTVGHPHLLRAHGITATPPMGGYVEFGFDGRILRLYRMPSSSRAYPLAVEKKAEYYRKMFEDVL